MTGLKLRNLFAQRLTEKQNMSLTNLRPLLKFATKICRHDLMLQEARDDQQKSQILINKLNNNYNPTNLTKIKEKDDTLKSTKNCILLEKRLSMHLRKVFFRT